MARLFWKPLIITFLLGLALVGCGTNDKGSPTVAPSADLRQRPVEVFDPCLNMNALEESEFDGFTITAEAKDAFRGMPYRTDHSEGRKLIYQGINQPLFFYIQYDFSQAHKGCLWSEQATTFLPFRPHPGPQHVVKGFFAHRDGTWEMVEFFRDFFVVERKDGSKTVSGPRTWPSLTGTSMSVAQLRSSSEFESQSLRVTAAENRRVLDWLSQALGIRLNAADRQKLLSNRTYYLTHQTFGGSGTRSISQIPVLSLYQHSLGLVGLPRQSQDIVGQPPRQANPDSVAHHYLQARVTAEIASEFASRFFAVDGNIQGSTELVFDSAFLLAEPRYIFELIQKRYNFNSGHNLMIEVIGKPARDLKNEEITANATVWIRNFLARALARLKTQSQHMRTSLVPAQTLQQEMTRNTQGMEAVAEQFARAKEFEATTLQRIMLAARTSNLPGAMSEVEVQATVRRLREDAEEIKRRVRTAIQNDLGRQRQSRGYLDAYRFDHPMGQLNPAAFQ